MCTVPQLGMLQGPHADPLGFQELRVPALPQVLRPQVLPEQALRVRLLQGRKHPQLYTSPYYIFI
jgi:hypothetical protein